MTDNNPFADPVPRLPTLIPGFICETDVNMTILCHDRIFKFVTIIDDTNDNTLFTVESKGATSLTWRRKVFDASERQIFDLRRQVSTKRDWAVEDLEGRKICSVRHTDLLARNRSRLDAIVHGTTVDGIEDDVVVEVQPKGRSALSTIVNYEDVQLASIRKAEANDVYFLEKGGLDRIVWKTHVEKGADLSLVCFSASKCVTG